jgi:hypothetical protein
MRQNNYLHDMLLNFNSKSISLQKQEQLVLMELLTIHEIFERFSEIRTKFKWTEEDLKVLLSSKLLIGKIENNNVLISKSSIKSLIEYRNNVK